MMKIKGILFTVLLIALTLLIVLVFVRKQGSGTRISISYPFNHALFPPEFPAPTFEWQSKIANPAMWEVALITRNKKYVLNLITKEPKWTPAASAWDSIKKLSDNDNIYFRVTRMGTKIHSRQVTFRISRDSVNAPVMYRQMPLPSALAEKKLDSMSFMLINFGSTKPPHAAMKGFPVCGNCHSFTADGGTIALDLDAGLRDKGGYFISPIRDTVLFNIDNFRSWTRIEKRRTFGLFSKISPDGRYVVTTVKDRVVFLNYPFDSYQHFVYSQLFFPVNGHLAVYDRRTGELKELPGANLEEYVQSNPVWTPDGKNIIFSRADALPRDSDEYEIVIKDKDLINQYVERKKLVKFNLCMIPFNEGNGGKAVPVKGASDNGKSNYFPAVSPDGKWLVFCRAESFMLLMPDSRLYIVPVEGGRARELRSNFSSLNSWHSWSPNSKWIVFASKGLGAYTDMFLTHIDNEGNASIPVLVDKARAYYKVINYPEFVNRKPEKTFVMEYDYVELAHIKRTLEKVGKEKAIQLFHQLEQQQPFLFSEDCLELSTMLERMGLKDEARKYAERAKETNDQTIFTKQ
jgi:hypothetical protein